MVSVSVVLLLWCATSFQQVRYLSLLVANRLCVLCLRIAYKQAGLCFFLK